MGPRIIWDDMAIICCIICMAMSPKFCMEEELGEEALTDTLALVTLSGMREIALLISMAGILEATGLSSPYACW